MQQPQQQTISKSQTQNQNATIKSPSPPIKKAKIKYAIESILEKEYIPNFEITEKTIHFCIYRIDTSCYIETDTLQKKKSTFLVDKNMNMTDIFLPFLIYYLDDENKPPTMEYQEEMDWEEWNELDGDTKETTNIFETAIFEYFLQYLPSAYQSISSIYKGFFEHDERNIFCFFNITNEIEKPTNNLTPYTMHEMLQLDKLNIDVSKYFILYKKMRELYYYNNLVIQPKIGFADEIPLLENHDKLGLCFMFRDKPFGYSNEKKYAIFEIDTFDLFDDYSHLEEINIKQLQENIIHSNTILYEENGLLYIAVKNPTHFIKIV
jgi:hypothetical protein